MLDLEQLPSKTNETDGEVKQTRQWGCRMQFPQRVRPSTPTPTPTSNQSQGRILTWQPEVLEQPGRDQV